MNNLPVVAFFYKSPFLQHFHIHTLKIHRNYTWSTKILYNCPKFTIILFTITIRVVMIVIH